MKNKILLFLLLFSFLSESYSQADFKLKKDTLGCFLNTDDNALIYELDLARQDKKLTSKLFRANNLTLAYNVTMLGWLLVVPESISKWDIEAKFNIPAIKKQYISSYTKPPIIDDDMLIVNYFGHPYQGAYYYNTMRSQGSTVLESTLFCFGQSLLWEYGYEAGMEQPSIQDLITTPVLGAISGELIHRATLKMGRGGYKWYEKVFVCIFNPSFALNNKLKPYVAY